MDSIDAPRAVELLREATGDPYVLVRRLSGGETGAHEVVCAPREERLVLKWEVRPESQVLRREAVGLADLLRTRAGWPVPRQRTVDAGGCLLVLQEFMAGDPVSTLTSSMVDELVELHGARFGLGEGRSSRPWAERLTVTLMHGGLGYCRHDSLRRYDERTAALVHEIEAFGATLTRPSSKGATSSTGTCIRATSSPTAEPCPP